MKILFLTNIPTPYRVDFFSELGKLCELTVLYERKTADNRNVKWLNKRANNFNGHYLDGKNVGEDSSFSFEIIKFLKDQTFDLVVIGGYSTPTGMLAINYLKLKKIPFVLNIDGGLIKKDNLIKYCIKKYFISSASYWLSPGSSATEYLVHYGAKKNKTYEYPFTSIKEDDILTEYDLKKIEKSAVRDEIGITEKKVVITVGQIIHRKGIDVLIESAKKTKDIGFYIIGGEPTKEYQNMVDTWNLQNIHFVGFKTKSELDKYYLAADLFVLPTREDIWGLVVNEAMSKGLPIITTDKCVAGLELIKDGINGYIIPSEDSNKLKQAIENIIYDENALNRISVNNLIKIKKYTIESMVEAHIDIFNKILESR